MPLISIIKDPKLKEESLRSMLNCDRLGVQLMFLYELVLLFLIRLDAASHLLDKKKPDVCGNISLKVSSFSGLLSGIGVQPEVFVDLGKFRNAYAHNGTYFAQDLLHTLLSDDLMDLLELCRLVDVTLDFTKPL